jgi:hypothetical protein
MSVESRGPLDSPEVSVKLFVAAAAGVRLKELIPVFHRWIKEDLIEDELQIDVASYEHVPKGPGIVLICDKAHYYFDERAGRAGLRYRGRRSSRASGADAVTRAFRQVLQAARLLETDPGLEGRYAFRTDEVEIGVYDRLLAPSDVSTLVAIRADLEEAAHGLYGSGELTFELVSGPKEPFTVTMRAGASFTVEELLGRLIAVKP